MKYIRQAIRALAIAGVVLLSHTNVMAAGSVSQGFQVKVKLLPPVNKPGTGGIDNPVQIPPIPSHADAVDNVCNITTVSGFDSSKWRVQCTAAEVIASRYYKLPAYVWTNSWQVTGVLPRQISGIGMGTTSSLRVLHESGDELIEVWVSW